MTKVLIATDKPFATVAVKGIRKVIEEAGFELVLLEGYTSPEDFIKAVENVDAVIVRSDKTDKSVIDAGKNLKIVVRAGAGYDNIDLQAATSKGVCVMNTPGQNSNAVAELALGMMVYYARNFYNGKSGSELKDKKLGIHAYGAVGRNVSRIAKGFGMHVYAYDPFIPKEEIEKDGVTCVNSAEELYNTCNFISLHIPANSKTIESINYSLLSRIPSPAVLVNTARAEVIHEADLLKIFEEKK
jgi:D-3-phosphoglycerate dehydrogenase / 2-oxoglutarate reductase